MFRFMYKTLHLHKRDLDSNTTHIRFLHVRSISSTSSSNTTDSQSLTVSYLINSCGLSLESALTASKMVNIETTERPDSVLELLKAHGFTTTHISRMISKHPHLIFSDPEKILRPKIEFFESLGIVGPDLHSLICSNLLILRTSLKNRIIPTVDFIKGFVQTNDNLIRAIKAAHRVITCNFQKVVEPNISTLRAHGVPESLIGKLIMVRPQALTLNNDIFDEVASAIMQMGINPMSGTFILAINSMATLSKVKWEKKYELLMSLGWSEKEFNSAFKVQPIFMLCSEKKIRELMEFLVNKACLKPSDVSRCPNLLLASLEKKIIPRCSVLQVLISKGLISKNVDIVWVLNWTKKRFDVKFIDPFKHDAPEVIKAYQGEMGFQGFEDVASGITQKGFEPMSRLCISMSMINKGTWERKKELLMSLGWSEEEFNSAFKVQPMFMLCTEKKIRELMEFLVNKVCLKPSDVARCPNLLLTSLKKRITPRCSVLQVLMSKGLISKNVELVWVLTASKKRFDVKFIDPFKHDAPEVIKAYQGEMGFQGFDDIATAVRQMDFEPISRSFISVSTISRVNWEKKKEPLMRLGWSEEEFNSAFKVQPMFMLCSEKKIRELIEFFVNKVCLKPSDVARCPNLLLTSLEKRIIPRCSVLQILMSKGLISKNVDVVWVLNATKKRFDMKFIDPFKHGTPEVIKAYQGEMGFQGLNNGLEDGK